MGFISGVGGINQMGVCGRLVRPQSPIPLFPLYVPSVLLLQGGGHSLSPAALGWPALLDCRMRMTAFLPSHRTAAAGRSECPTTKAWHHRPNRHCTKFRRRRESSAYRQYRPRVSFSPIGR